MRASQSTASHDAIPAGTYPDDDRRGNDGLWLEALKGSPPEGQAGEHAKVVDGGGPRVLVADELEVRDEAQEGSVGENGLVEVLKEGDGAHEGYEGRVHLAAGLLLPLEDIFAISIEGLRLFVAAGRGHVGLLLSRSRRLLIAALSEGQ